MVRKIMFLFNKMKVFFIGLGLVFIVFSFLLNASYTIQLRYENADLRNQIFELENSLLSVEQELELANTDVYIHKKATEKLGLVKARELPVQVYEENVEEDEQLSFEEKQKIKFEMYIVDWYNELSNLIRK